MKRPEQHIAEIYQKIDKARKIEQAKLKGIRPLTIKQLKNESVYNKAYR